MISSLKYESPPLRELLYREFIILEDYLKQTKNTMHKRIS